MQCYIYRLPQLFKSPKSDCRPFKHFLRSLFSEIEAEKAKRVPKKCKQFSNEKIKNKRTTTQFRRILRLLLCYTSNFINLLFLVAVFSLTHPHSLSFSLFLLLFPPLLLYFLDNYHNFVALRREKGYRELWKSTVYFNAWSSNSELIAFGTVSFFSLLF